MIKFILKTIGFLLVTVLLIYYYARDIEPHLLKVTEHNIVSHGSNTDMKGLKVVQFTDTHVGEFFGLEDMKKVVDKINSLNPDIVVFTGDLVDHWGTFTESKQLGKLLSSIKAPLGKFAVFGNHDYGSSGYKIYEDFMEQANFKVLVNEVKPIVLQDGTRINIGGGDDALLGKTNISTVVKNMNSKDYNILLMHEPDLVNELSVDYVDIQLSGHSHGGQVEIPGMMDRILPKYATKYRQGMYQINDRTKLYVNTGIGSTKVPFRLGNIPEISLFIVD